jgi:hypothetical protein
MLTIANTYGTTDHPIEQTSGDEDLPNRVCRVLELPIR